MSVGNWGLVHGQYDCPLCGKRRESGTQLDAHLVTRHRDLSVRERGEILIELRRANGWPTGTDVYRAEVPA